VEAAALQFAEHGFAECDMERVASAIGVAKGTLYLYFPGKQELFFACVDWGMVEMQRLIFEAADASDDPMAQIATAIRAYLHFFDEHPEYVELMMQERAMFRTRKKGTYFEHRDQIRPRFREIYGSLIRSGILRNDVPIERMLDAIGALLYGTMFINHAAGREVSLDDQHAMLMKSIFGGLLTDEGRLKMSGVAIG
jgi:AcrR family transcriptional regulator